MGERINTLSEFHPRPPAPKKQFCLDISADFLIIGLGNLTNSCPAQQFHLSQKAMIFKVFERFVPRCFASRPIFFPVMEILFR